MNKAIWFMEGLSSQRDIVQSVIEMRESRNLTFTVIASHRSTRPEITSVADISLREPKADADRLCFIAEVVAVHNVVAIQAGRNCTWFEENRPAIEAMGVSLTTGATSLDMFALADDKVRFARFMEQHQLPVVHSTQINSSAELQKLLQARNEDQNGVLQCIKPVTGIYGLGFWILDWVAKPMAAFDNPDNRRVHPSIYLEAMQAEEDRNQQSGKKEWSEPMVLMPYLPGPERSVDMLVEKGKVIAAVARRKEGPLQYMEQAGEAFELGKACAEIMQADGLINVQTRNDTTGKPVLLEINMRPSGGICYTRATGVNLPGIFALRQLGLIDQQTAADMSRDTYSPAVVRSVTSVIPLPSATPVEAE
ncbi:ATP-grasp domain-containing protein [Aeromonas salmonicida]|uniref:ATP-grasp domain-containing protein n=1 Tax=Aeromonas salmonicida TaxID=645 RepID=UPI00259E82BD|nr:ATP-grasp domain-containing protein [Aeromonas salmonicida]MDM5103838.1 ATP-grasp domain-containing protein [Aeromonas salmonicida]